MESMKRAIWVLAPLLAVLVVSPAAFAVVNLTVSPSQIAPNGLVTLSFCTTATDHVKYISVTTPSGTSWNSTSTDFYPKTCPALTTFTFGGNTPGWVVTKGSGTTQTGEAGAYSVRVEYTHVKGGTEEFHVNQPFNVPSNVPEFGLPAVAVVSIAFLGLVLLRKRALPKLQ
jgi:hypothetical protein